MKTLILLTLALTVASPLHAQSHAAFFPSTVKAKPPAAGDKILAKAFKRGLTEFMVKFNATVIAHNIDLAPRVRKLNLGDRITTCGEYIWNGEGGLIHKTHLDPGNDDPHGWIRHKGERYQ